MIGGYVHERIMLDPLEAGFRKNGGTVHREYPVTLGRSPLTADLLIESGPYRIVCEAERSLRRTHRDLLKAIQLDADLLLIVVPDWQLARAVKRRLAGRHRQLPSSKPMIMVLPLGVVLQRFRKQKDFVIEALVTRQESRKSPVNRPREQHGNSSVPQKLDEKSS
jgi:hypothetical protein